MTSFETKWSMVENAGFRWGADPGLLGESDYRTGADDTDQSSSTCWGSLSIPGCKPNECIRARNIPQGNASAVTIGRQAPRGQCDDG